MNNRIYVLCLALVASAAACSATADPCAAEKGLCVTVQIDPSPTVKQIDSVSIRAIAPGLDHAYPAAPAQSGRLTLPVAVAVVFSGVSNGAAIELDVTGLLAGKPAGSGKARATLSATLHPTVHVMLGPVSSPLDAGVADAADDGGALDAAPLGGLDIGFTSPDLAGSTLAVDNATHEFDPLSVGNVSAAFAFDISNAGPGVSAALQRSVSGDAGDFVINSDTCGGLKLAAKGSCAVAVQFKPTSFGTKRLTVTFDGGSAGMVVIQVAGVATASETLTVTINGTAPGAVAAPGLTCNGNTCSGTYTAGATAPTVMLTATPAAWANFVGWSGGCSGTALTCMVSMDASKQVTATFNQRPLVPSHVDPSYYKPGAADLSGVTAIDTMALTINGAAQSASVFTHDAHGWAVLSVGAWTVDKDIAVSGNAPLVIVAAGAVDVRAIIHGEAKGAAPGPGGATDPATSAGGGPGGGQQSNTGGGGGGNFGGGASGGDSGGAAGATYGALISDLSAGSAGGSGSFAQYCGDTIGGGGGGSIQISSAVSIVFENGAGLNVGGGGGQNGCLTNFNNTDFVATAAGGGSGGEAFVEAPTVVIGGILAANGGAGGVITGSSSGSAAPSGLLANSPAIGTAMGTNKGANGAYGSTAATIPVGGSGGGGVGRIWVRTHSTPASVTGTISPPARLDTTL